MNKEQQRIAISRVDGWHPEVEQLDLLPDYLKDLNAMHEVEKVLKLDQIPRYLDKLAEVTQGCLFPSPGDLNGMCRLSCITHATASQRAEAFLRTLNLWEDSP